LDGGIAHSLKTSVYRSWQSAKQAEFMVFAISTDLI